MLSSPRFSGTDDGEGEHDCCRSSDPRRSAQRHQDAPEPRHARGDDGGGSRRRAGRRGSQRARIVRAGGGPARQGGGAASSVWDDVQCHLGRRALSSRGRDCRRCPLASLQHRGGWRGRARRRPDKDGGWRPRPLHRRGSARCAARTQAQCAALAPRPCRTDVNRGGGSVWPLDRLQAVATCAHANGLFVHMDGARLLNAVVASGISAKDFADPCDAVWLDLSKGLGRPVGAVLAGSRDFVEEAWR